jgi:hypothetical protein
MPVDRRLRDELAQVLALHMRDRTDAARLHGRLRALHDQLAPIDATAARIADDVLVELECGDDCKMLGSIQNWDFYRRRVALLLSDLAVPPREAPRESSHDLMHARTLARALLIVMIMSLTFAPWTKGYAFFACWIISPAIWLLATTKTRTPSFGSPFESEAQWVAHEPLLHELYLPAWEASPHYRKPVPQWRRAVSGAVTKVLLFGAVYLLTALVWPLSLVAMSFPRDVNDERNPRVATR